MVYREMALGAKILVANLFGVASISVIQLLGYILVSLLFDVSKIAGIIIFILLFFFTIPIYVYVSGFVAERFGWK